MQDFDYVLARTVPEVIARLCDEAAAQVGPVHVFSGGTDLLPQLREGRRSAALLVDVKGVPEANVLDWDDKGGLTIGAAVPCLRICGDPRVARDYPGLVDGMSLIGGAQIQGRATVGGNLCNASPAADSIPALIVHQATAIILGPDGERTVPVADFCTGPGRNCLRRGEFLLAIAVPPTPPGFGAAYLRFIPRNEMDIAVTGAAVAVRLNAALNAFESARVALGAVAPGAAFRARDRRIPGRAPRDRRNHRPGGRSGPSRGAANH